MYEMAKQARAAMKAKAAKLGGGDPSQKVDASSWMPDAPMNTGVKTGARPLSRRAFKSGGKVHGMDAKTNMGRKPRKAGGSAKGFGKEVINRNVKDANQEREGIKHVGGFKKGGSAKRHKYATDGKVIAPKDPRNPLPLTAWQRIKGPGETRPTFGSTDVDTTGLSDSDRAAMDALVSKSTARKRGGKTEHKHDDEAADRSLVKKMVKKDSLTGKKGGGRTGKFVGGAMGGGTPMAPSAGILGQGAGAMPPMPRKSGGRTKEGKTHINILVGAGKPAGAGDMMGAPHPMAGPTAPPPMPPQMPMGMPPGAPAMPGGMPGAPAMPGGLPGGRPMMPPGMPPMGRKSGGRAKTYC